MCQFAKSMKHLLWRFIRCLIAIAVIYSEAFIRWSLMEIDCGIKCFSPELDESLGVNHHRPGYFSDCTDHLFCNTIVMVSIWRPWFVCSTAGSEDMSEGLIVVFSQSRVVPESLDLKSHWIYPGLKWLVTGGAGHGYLIWEQQYGYVPCVVVDE